MDDMPASRRILTALRLAALLGGLAQSVSGAAGALLARDLGGSDAVAGLPQALLVAGSAIAALGISALTRHRGRGPALAAGAGVAALGSALVVPAAAGSLPGVLAGCLLLGSGTATVMLGRYAAADTAPAASRARAMGSVLVATTVGAVTGPNLLAPAETFGRALGLAPLTGPFLVAAACFAAASALILRRVPAVAPQVTADPAPGRPDRSVLLGLAVLAPTNLVMVAVMTMAPVHLHHTGLGLGSIGVVISLHIAGMFAPSPLSGWLTDRVGPAPATALAAAVLTASTLLAALGAGSPPVLGTALVLLGVGWNLGLIAGSTLLTAGATAARRPRREGWGEVAMGSAAAGGGAASGVVAGSAGYPVLAAGAAAVAAVVLVMAWRVRMLPGAGRAADGTAQPVP